MAALSNLEVKGSNRKKILFVISMLLVYYYYFYYSRGKQLTREDAQTFIGQSILLIALRNTPIIIL